MESSVIELTVNFEENFEFSDLFTDAENETVLKEQQSTKYFFTDIFELFERRFIEFYGRRNI